MQVYIIQIQRFYAVSCTSLPDHKTLSKVVKCSCPGFLQTSMNNRLCKHAGAFLLACLANREKLNLSECADVPSDGESLSSTELRSRKFYESKRSGMWQLVDAPVEKQPITENELDPAHMHAARMWVENRKATLAEDEGHISKSEERNKDDLRVRFRHYNHYDDAANDSDMRFAKLWVQSRKAALAESEEQQSKRENRAKDDLRVRFHHYAHYAANNSSARQPSMPSPADSVSSSSIDDESAYPKSSRDSRTSSSGEGSSEQGGAPQGQAPASPAEPFPALRGPYIQTDLPIPYDVRIPESVALGWRSRFEGYDHTAAQAVEPFCTEPLGELCCFLTGQQALKMARYLLSTTKDEDACFVGFTSLPMCRCITSIFLSAAAHDRACS